MSALEDLGQMSPTELESRRHALASSEQHQLKLYAPVSILVPDSLGMDVPFQPSRPRSPAVVPTPAARSLANATSPEPNAVVNLFASPLMRDYLCGRSDREPVLCVQQQRPQSDGACNFALDRYETQITTNTYIFVWMFDSHAPAESGRLDCRSFDDMLSTCTGEELCSLLSDQDVRSLVIPAGRCWLLESGKARGALAAPATGFKRNVVVYTCELDGEPKEATSPALALAIRAQ